MRLLLAVLALLAAAAPAAADVELRRAEVAPSPGGPWEAVELPHLLEHRPVESAFGGGVGWYRLRFDRPGPGAWAVRFGAVRRTARVTLNGRPLGTHADPYVPFVLPLRGLRERGNELVVRVDSRKGEQPREGWWNWGGISREVRLVRLGTAAIEHPALLSDVRCAGPRRCAAAFRFAGAVRNTTARPLRATVRVRVEGVGERTVRTRPLQPGEAAQVTARLPVREPRLWAPGRPALYEGVVEAGGVRTPLRGGLRSVAVRDGRLLVNGEAAQLRGASIQEDLPGRGAALRDADVRRIVDDLRAVGADVTRAHYLLDERLLAALDEAGIAVWSQAPVYHRDDLLATAAGREDALRSVERTVLEARRHPSVITHSVANELDAEADRVPGVAAFLRDALRVTRELDPTLPPSVDLLSYPGLPAQEAFAAFPLLGINTYFGWYRGKRERSTADLQDLGPFLDRSRRLYPRSALVLTEFGAESTFAGPADVKETYAFQARYVRDVLRIARERPWLGGAVHWTLREFAVKPDWDGGANRRGVERDGIHNKGLLTYDGRRKPAWEVARADFIATPAVRAGAPVPGRMPAQRGPQPLGWLALLGAIAAVAFLLALAGRSARALLRPPPVPVARPALRVLPGGADRDAA